jgi:long-chain acyl-CoA synthetase
MNATATPHLTLDLISGDSAGTIPDLFRARVARSPEACAYVEFDPEGNQWRHHSWRDVETEVARWQAALAAEGLAPGERVAVAARNSLGWVCFDQAALARGLVVVPLYVGDTAQNTAYILADSGARVLLLDDPGQWLAMADYTSGLTHLQRIVCLSRCADAGEQRLTPLEDWLPRAAPPAPPLVDDPDGLATIIYTSGTTGQPKGVMHSHRTILWNARAVGERIPAYREDLFLSFLPLAHAFERTAGYYLPMMAGSCVAYARSVKTLSEDLLVHRPSVLLSVPRVYEKIYAAMHARMSRSAVRWRLLRATAAIGWRRLQGARGRGPGPGPLGRLAWPFLRRAVADKVMARLGGRLRVAVSGGAPLAESLTRFFAGLGLPLVEGYGLTEAAPIVSGNPPEANVPGAVGRPLAGVEVRIGANRELLVRSPSVMLGYWGRPADTEKALDPDGWLHTGDAAELRDGLIYLGGRIDEILITSTGEKVAPGDVELALTNAPLFDQAMLVGDRRPYVGALLVLNRDGWASLAEGLGLAPEDEASLSDPRVKSAVLEIVQTRLAAFPRPSQVRAVHLFRNPWTLEEGLLTPTMKLKREVLHARFARQIADLYRGHETPS